MSRPDDGHRSFFPVGNPFRVILPGGPHLPRKLQALLTSYEDALASSLRKLKPENAAEVLTLSWMMRAVDCLSELHASIVTLITELELPVSDWDEKWVDIYLNSSVKLLDVCIALSSELARLDQGQLLVRYVLHLLDTGAGLPSLEQLKRAELSLKEWMDKVGAAGPRLDSCSTALQELAGSLCLMKVKNSAKGKVLMRALYGIETVTVFICSVFVAALSGSPKPLVDLRVPRKFGWSQAFGDLHVTVSRELGRKLSRECAAAVKELEEVEACVRKLHELTRTAQLKEKNVNLACDVIHSVEVVMSDSTSKDGGLEDNLKLADNTGRECELTMPEITTDEGTREAEMTLKQDTRTMGHGSNEFIMLESISQHNNINKTNGISDENSTVVPERTSAPEGSKQPMVPERTSAPEGSKQPMVPERTSAPEGSQQPMVPEKTSAPDGIDQLLDCISSMSKSAEGLRVGLDSLSKRVGDFFQIVLTGRDALLCNLRMSDAASKVAEVRS
ncbi:UPF0496 protein 4 [Lolium perenne]|uniref:UPF0496 protein 4 n=1 Tax=Lolium perenne TaxID=4522 RepID=UPI0021F5AF6B|nr:UPF0496 protein 4 [Lolium perenne]XP_051192358.1 UPF0496 protein 4 [Lolium perenne]